MKKRSRCNIVLAVLFCTASSLIAQTQSREVTNSWSGIENIAVSHRYGTMDVLPSNDGNVRLEALIVVKAQKDADAQVVLDHFTILDRQIGDDLELETSFDSKSWITNNNISTIKYENGDKAKGIRKIEIQYKLYLPNLDVVKLSNKYNDIIIHDKLAGDLHIKQYDADVVAEEVGGNLYVELKYGTGKFDGCSNADLELYDSEFELGKAKDIDLKSKYSEFRVTACDNIEISSYDDKGTIESVEGTLRMKDKYSEYAIGDVGESDIRIYDSELRLERTNRLDCTSKYTRFDIKRVGDLNIQASYDDTYEIRSVGSMNCSESKYTTYEFDLVESSMVIDSYDDEIFVSEISKQFELFEIDCKYTDVRLPLSVLDGYQLEVNADDTEIKYNSEPSDQFIHKESDDELEIRGTIGNANATTRVIVRSYGGEIKLY